MPRFAIALPFVLLACCGVILNAEEPQDPEAQRIDLRSLVLTEHGDPTKQIDTEKIVYSDRGLEVSLPIYGVRPRGLDAFETTLHLPKGVERLTAKYRVYLSPGVEHHLYCLASNGLIYPFPISITTADNGQTEADGFVKPDTWHTITLHILPNKYSAEFNGKEVNTGTTKRSLTERPFHLIFRLNSSREGGRVVLEAPTVEKLDATE